MQYNYPQYPQYAPYQPYAPQNDPALAQKYREYQEAEMYKKALRRTSNHLGVLLIVFIVLEFVLGLIYFFISGLSFDAGSIKDLLGNGLISCIIFFVTGAVYCLIKKLSFARLFPFERIGAKTLSMLCVIGLCFSLMSNYVVDLVNNTFGLFGIENSGGNIDAGSEPNVIVYLLTVAVLPAFVEEFAFRGVIMGSLRPYSEGLAILVSSAAFALMHGNFVQLPFTFCCGLVFAIIDIKTNSLMPSIIVHFLNNGLSVLADILVSYKIFSELYVNLFYGVIFIVLGVLSLIFIKKIINEKGQSFFTLKNSDTVLPFKTKVKTAASSPTMITFAVLMLIFCFTQLAAG